MDWKKKYVRTLSKEHFDADSVIGILKEIVIQLNKELESTVLEKVKFGDGDQLIFPDCIIDFDIQIDKLTFTKHPRSNPSSIEKTINIGVSDGYYKLFSSSDKRYEDFSQELIEEVIQILLFNKK